MSPLPENEQPLLAATPASSARVTSEASGSGSGSASGSGGLSSFCESALGEKGPVAALERTSSYTSFVDEIEDDIDSISVTVWRKVVGMVSEHRYAVLSAIVLGGLFALSSAMQWLDVSWEAYFTLHITYCAIILMVKDAPPDVVMLGASMIFVTAGITKVEDALGGLSSPGVVSIAMLFVVSAGIQESGGMDIVLRKVLGNPSKTWVAQLRMMIPVAVVSAFLNNTPLVAMMIPIVEAWSQRTGVPTSQLMMPLSFASMFGGTCTIIGSSTNLVLVAVANKHKALAEPIGFFELAVVGLPLAVLGMIYIMVASPHLLPNVKSLADEPADVDEEAAQSFRDTTHSKLYTMDFIIEPGSVLAGESIEQSGLLRINGASMTGVSRDSWTFKKIEPSFTLMNGDVLNITGDATGIRDIRKIPGCVPATVQVNKLGKKRRHRCLAEVVIARHSVMVGHSLRDTLFRKIFNAAVLALRRGNTQLEKEEDIGRIPLAVGDILLIECPATFVRQYRNDPNFALVCEVDDSKPPRHSTYKDTVRKALTVALLVATVGLSSLEVMPLVVAATFASFIMIMSKCITVDEGFRAVKGRVLLTVAAAFGVGAAIEASGAAKAIAEQLVNLSAPGGTPALLVAVYLLTAILSSVVSNNATVVLMFPIANQAALSLGISVRALVFTLMFAASASYCTPIGYQTNLMVYGPGKYTFADFFKFGFPLQLLMMVVTVVLCSALY
eukprot:GFYU01003155.1.p1 GENE.GFYU01003155.1~~GFYU01003155.1.p1  ORF type:complete len:727 (+),score=205.51 GFYU01003155.1:148-2328(+)